ncbi:MAG: hypothetical protein SFU27_11975 [Thermonemataceae bacterium]|nr:hypothetical protein [Thermonemataceae bacterium]
MIIPKRKAEDYTPPSVINEYDQIYEYIKAKKTLAEIKMLVAMPEEQTEKMYIKVLKSIREQKDKKMGVFVMGATFFVAGLSFLVLNIKSILFQIGQNNSQTRQTIEENSKFFEFQHPLWLLIFGLMTTIGLLLVIGSIFSKPKM